MAKAGKAINNTNADNAVIEEVINKIERKDTSVLALFLLSLFFVLRSLGLKLLILLLLIVCAVLCTSLHVR